jgi:hypothetical protein
MKHLYLALICCISINSFAQSIPNPGFESWVTNPTYEDPQGWGTYNFLTVYGNPATATKSTDAHSGSYALRMESKKLTNNPSPAVYPDTVHTVYTGTVIPTVFGFPYTQKPNDLKLFYKCTPVNNSTAGVLSYLFKWNSAQHRRDTIAVAASYIAASATYQQLTVPFIYNNTITPDTAVIYMSPIAVFTQNQLGAVLLVDDIQFSVATSVNDNNSGGPSLFINDGKLMVQGLSDQATLTLYSIDGKALISDLLVGNGIVETHIPAGVYLYNIKTSDHIYAGKAAIVR